MRPMQAPPIECARSVLIADDQPAFRKLLRRVLAELPADVIECPDGAAAVVAYEQHRPDWALLDWMMPNLDGLAATRSIRARHPDARCVVITVHFTQTLAREADEAGACACLPKEKLPDLLALLRGPEPTPIIDPKHS